MADPTPTKTCLACGITAPLDGFHKNRRRSDGLQPHCKSCVRIARSLRYAADPDAAKASLQKWRDANRERSRQLARESARRAYRADPEKFREIARAKQAANPQAGTERARRRRARLLSASVGDVDLELLWRTQGATCPLCLTPINPALSWPEPHSRSLDHIVPLSKGGTHEQSNLQWTHLVCNQHKGASVP